MKKCFAYIRVSTPRQGEGVSLPEQRRLITEYAERNGITITRWFVEKKSAAKRNRPVFIDVLKRLRRGEAQGVAMHKIDRSARNLRDWADLGELIDAGVEVHFVADALDLQTRGGRLSADIQAVVAADYIKNLREETKKGFYGRLRQGLYPLPAPLGYRNAGSGKPKEIDPVTGPLLRCAFSLYATGNYSLDSLQAEGYRFGLRNHAGGIVTKNDLSVILNNPFYRGLIKIRRTGETFDGIHEPLVDALLWRRVQDVLRGRTRRRGRKHEFLFGRLLTCGECGKHPNGEKQKGHTYYRCHTKDCQVKCTREELVDAAIERELGRLTFSDEEKDHLERLVEEATRNATDIGRRVLDTLRVKLGQVAARIERLTDALLDGLLEKELFNERKERLLSERKDLEDQRTRAEREPERIPRFLQILLELSRNALLSYRLANPPEKRRLLQITTSNRMITPNGVVVELAIPFLIIANRGSSSKGCPLPNATRTEGQNNQSGYMCPLPNTSRTEGQSDRSGYMCPLPNTARTEGKSNRSGYVCPLPYMSRAPKMTSRNNTSEERCRQLLRDLVAWAETHPEEVERLSAST